MTFVGEGGPFEEYWTIPMTIWHTIDPTSATVADMYKLLIGSIVPRPIAFVSTQSSAGIGNLAPFSFFNGVSSNPPCLMISIARRPNGEKKDTLRNIEESGEFVVNTAQEHFIERLVQCGANYPYGENELEKMGFTPLASIKVKPPRVKESAVHFECRVYQLVEVGQGGAGSSTVVIGQILLAHASDHVYQGGKINLQALKPVARVGGHGYVTPGAYREIPIPELPSKDIS